MSGPSPIRLALPMLVVLFLTGFANLFLRTSMGVLAPNLAADLGLSATMLGAASSAYFFAYAAMQIPTGIMLDRFGARRAMTVLFTFAALGVGWFALARSDVEIVAARTLIGAGCAGVFAGAFFLLARWFPPERFSTYGGALNSFSMLGTFMAATPLAAAAAMFGWRGSFVAVALFVGVLTIAGWLLIRDWPPGKEPAHRPAETPREILKGLRQVMATPGMPRLATAGLSLATGSTVLSIWGGPYLHDVHGLGDVGRGNVMLFMALAGVAGHFLTGQLVPMLNTIKGVIMGGTVGSIAVCVFMAAAPTPGVTAVTVAFALLGLCVGFPAIVHTHARALVPPHLVGRGITTINTFVIAAIAAMQIAVGFVIDLFPHEAGVAPEAAYRTAFGFMAAAATVTLVVYGGIADVKPRGDARR